MALIEFLFIVAVPLVLVAGAVVTLFAIGALFDALDNPLALLPRIQAIFRRPLAPPKTPGRESYYKAYWQAKLGL
jgi:hypothetical protein